MNVYKIIKSFIFQSIPFFGICVYVQTHSKSSHIQKKMKFDSIFEWPTFENMVHYIHVASTIYLVTIFTLKIRKEKNNFNSVIISCFRFITFWSITSMTPPITSCLLQKFFYLFIILQTWIQPISCWMNVFLWLCILMFLYDMCIRLV